MSSPDFDASSRSREFLRFVVKETLEGREDAVTQHGIATLVFGRREDFDPSTDPIVRMQAGRVRRSLEHYYLTSGLKDPVAIEIPKGTYVPVFRLRDGAGSEQAPVLSGGGPTILLSPFQNLTQDASFDFVAQGLVSDLAIELDRYRELRVLLRGRVESPGSGTVTARFAVNGALNLVEDALKISVQLVDTTTGELLWGEQYRQTPHQPELAAFLDELAQIIAATLGEERGVLFHHLSRETKDRRSDQLGTYEAILRFYHFDLSPTLESFYDALASLRHAVDLEPDNGLAWALLARLYGDNYSLELTDERTSIQDAFEFAHAGVRLEPADQRTRLVLAFTYLLNDNLEEGRREAEAALNLNPDSLFFLDAIGYLLTLLGDWERGPLLSKKAVRLNPYCRDVVHAGLWLDAIRRDDYEAARFEAEASTTSDVFWQPMMQGVALAHLNDLDDAARCIEHLLLLKPNFRDRGRWLVQRYVKFDEIVERIEAGLDKAGLSLT